LFEFHSIKRTSTGSHSTFDNRGSIAFAPRGLCSFLCFGFLDKSAENEPILSIFLFTKERLARERRENQTLPDQDPIKIGNSGVEFFDEVEGKGTVIAVDF
jgi:hypothetical protein